MPGLLSVLVPALASGAPTITIREWAKSLRVVAFVVTADQPVVTLTATLTGSTQASATITATQANAVTGLQLPIVPAGLYRLTLTVTDASGRTTTTTRTRVEVA